MTTSNFFNSAEELIDAFDVRSNSDYEKITPLSDRKVGFSIQRKYPSDIRYFPPRLITGEADTVAIIHVVYEHPEEANKKTNKQDSRIPLVIRVGKFSRYTTAHYDYNFDDDKCPTKESVERSKISPAPIDLDYDNGFFYNHKDSKFYDDKKSVLNGVEVLNKVFKDHCDTVHLLKGLKLRFKLRSRSLGIYAIDIFVSLLVNILNSVFGRTIDASDKLSAYFSGYKREDFKKLSTESLSVFGYSTARRVILLFCFMTVASFSYYFLSDTKSKYLKTVFSNSFLSLTYSISIIWILDELLPVFLFRLMNLLINIRSKCAFRKFKAF